MAYIEWSEKYCTGISEIDRQHKGLVDLIQIMETVCFGKVTSEDERRKMLGKVIHQLLAYTMEHFKYEENMMKEVGYPKFLEHKRKHETMSQTVKKYKAAYENNHHSPEELLALISAWLDQHILKSDREYIPYATKPDNKK